jgi:rhodanese-related sulfurtransferase
MAKSLTPVTAKAAQDLAAEGALLVDIREPGEVARVRIPGAANVPLSGFGNSALPAAEGQAVVFFCASGGRTTSYAAQLAAKAGEAKAYVMQGGISSWMMAGLPTEQGDGEEAGAGRSFFSRLLG